MSNRTYDRLKLIALLVIPFCGFITAVANALGYDASVVVAIVTAFDTFLGAVIKILSDNYARENSEEVIVEYEGEEDE